MKKTDIDRAARIALAETLDATEVELRIRRAVRDTLGDTYSPDVTEKILSAAETLVSRFVTALDEDPKFLSDD